MIKDIVKIIDQTNIEHSATEEDIKKNLPRSDKI